MTTEVVHGPGPIYSAACTPARFALTLEGQYTLDPSLAACGVTGMTYASASPAKRRNELLALRTAFLDWWAVEWQREGGCLDVAAFDRAAHRLWACTHGPRRWWWPWG